MFAVLYCNARLPLPLHADLEARCVQAWRAIQQLRKEHQSQGKPVNGRDEGSARCWSWLVCLGGARSQSRRFSSSSSQLLVDNEVTVFKREVWARRQREAALHPELAAEREREERVAALNSMFVCPLSGHLMKDPVMADDGASIVDSHAVPRRYIRLQRCSTCVCVCVCVSAGHTNCLVQACTC